jgi:hypothetical protein
VKINEIIAESHLKEFGIKDLAKGFNKGTLGKSIGQGINKAGQQLGKSIVGGGIADKALAAGSVINKGADAVARGIQGAPGAAKNLAKGLGQSVKDAGQMAQDVLPGTSAYVKSFGNAGNSLAKQFVGKDPNAPWLDKGTLPGSVPSYAMYGDDYKPNHAGEIFVVKARGQEYFKSYADRWYQKSSMNPNDFSVTHPIDDYKDYAVLDRILQQGDYDIVDVKQDPMGPTRFTATKRRPANSNDQQASNLVDKNGNPIQ